MKTLLAIIFTLILINSAYAGEKINGYRDLKWNSPPIEKEMDLLEKRGSFTFYRYNGDNNIDGIPIDNFTCTFCKNRFCSFFGVINGVQNFSNFTKLMYDMYGPPNYNKPPYGFWLGETDIFLYFDKKEQAGYFLFYYNPIFTELDMEKAKLLKKQKQLEPFTNKKFKKK